MPLRLDCNREPEQIFNANLNTGTFKIKGAHIRWPTSYRAFPEFFSRGKRGREGEKYWSTGDDTSSHQCHQTGEASIMVTVRKKWAYLCISQLCPLSRRFILTGCCWQSYPSSQTLVASSARHRHFNLFVLRNLLPSLPRSASAHQRLLNGKVLTICWFISSKRFWQWYITN